MGAGGVAPGRGGGHGRREGRGGRGGARRAAAGVLGLIWAAVAGGAVGVRWGPLGGSRAGVADSLPGWLGEWGGGSLYWMEGGRSIAYRGVCMVRGPSDVRAECSTSQQLLSP